MGKIYITGHRNPDMDSVCAAYAYAQYKNLVSENKCYYPVRCGHLSESLKRQLSLIEFNAPPYMRDVYPKVSDVMITPTIVLDANEPIYNLVKVYNMKQSSVIPVTDKGKFYGLLSVDDITAWFLKDNKTDYPVYDLNIDNIISVLPGTMLKRGERSNMKVRLLAGAAAFDEFASFISEDIESLVVIGYRPKHIEHAIKMNVPAIIVSTCSSLERIDLNNYNGFVFVTKLGTAETLRRLRMVPSIKGIMDKQRDKIQVNELFDTARDLLSTTSLRGFPVFNADKWVGFVTRRCFLHKPKYSVILVDHNEISQSIRGLEEADVLEIIDHHRLDAPKTDTPILIDAEPVGSTCTIVYRIYVRNNITPDYLTSKVLLTGIICDTLILKSPTTTSLDIYSAFELAKLCEIEDIDSFGKELFSFSESLSSRNAEEVINSDFKIYNQNSVRVGIGQCEVPFLRDLDDYKDRYLETLEAIKNANNLSWAMLLVTDVLRGNSVLLTSACKYERKLSYKIISDHVYDLPGVLSRKKQLLPEIINILL